MKLTNINGTSDNTCECSSWLEHWKTFGGLYSVSMCAVEGCKEKAEVGAHVQKAGSDDWYIVPLCKSHNAERGGSISVADSTKLAPANVSQTCGKRR